MLLATFTFFLISLRKESKSPFDANFTMRKFGVDLVQQPIKLAMFLCEPTAFIRLISSKKSFFWSGVAFTEMFKHKYESSNWQSIHGVSHFHTLQWSELATLVHLLARLLPRPSNKFALPPGGTPIHKLYRYVPLWRVGFLSSLV